MPRPHTSVINQPLKSKDWLELKDDQVLAPKATPPPQSLALSDPDENTQRISRRTVDSFVGEVSTTNEGRITAPLGHTGDGLSFTDSDKIEDRQPVVSKQQDGSKESDNFLNWFSNKTKEEKQKTAPSR